MEHEGDVPVESSTHLFFQSSNGFLPLRICANHVTVYNSKGLMSYDWLLHIFTEHFFHMTGCPVSTCVIPTWSFEKRRMREWTVECSELVQLIRSIKVEINIWTFFWRVCGNGKFSLKLLMPNSKYIINISTEQSKFRHLLE